MPRLSSDARERIRKLSYADLQQIVLKLATKEKSAYDFILVNFLDKEFGERELFEQTKADLDLLFRKGYKGRSAERQLANMLKACVRRIKEFTNISKNKVMEADLLMYVLEVPFSLSTTLFGSHYTTYDTKVALLLRRVIGIVIGKLHEDYRMNYTEKINQYLHILHRASHRFYTIHALPKSI